jgi:hypothetical protein
VLLTAHTSAAYAPALSGHPPSLLFVHDGVLIAQPFDWQSLELRGERAAIVPEIRYQRWNQARFSVSSKGVLLYQAGCAENLQLTWFDRQGKSISAAGLPNDFLSIKLSPDDRYLAVHRHDDPDTTQPTIWVMDLLRDGAVFRITDADLAVAELTAVWAWDGGEILFSRGDDRRMGLFRRALSGGAARCVLDTEGPKFPADWSSDGKFIAYTSQFPDYRNLHTWIATLSDRQEEAKSSPFLQHSCNEFSAEFSPEEAGEAPRWVACRKEMTVKHITANNIAITAAPALSVVQGAQAADKGCSNASLYGTFAYTGTGVLTAPPPLARPFATVGGQTFDGNGNTTATAWTARMAASFR